jgi:hypothetical protein
LVTHSRRVAGAVIVLLVAATLATVGSTTAGATLSGTMTRFAGGVGRGAATNLAMTPRSLAWHDGRLFITDDRYPLSSPPFLGAEYPGVVRSLDPATGLTTVAAGVGPGGFSGDGGAATRAQLNDPTGIAFDDAGNLYIADQLNNRIRRISPTGTMSTLAGNGSSGFSGDGGPALRATLANPTKVDVASDGSVLFVDASNGRLRRIDPSGTISTVAGSGNPSPPSPPPVPTLDNVQPRTVTTAPSGVVYFVDVVSGELIKLSPDGALSVIPTGLQWGPTAVTPERSGTLLVTGGATLRRVDPETGRADTIAGTLGQPGFAGDGGPASNARLGDVTGVEVDEAGAIYLADRTNYRVRRIALDGTITTVAGNGMASHGGEGGPATNAQMTSSAHLEVSAAGVYFSQADSTDNIGRLGMVAPDGVLRTVVDLPGEGVAGMAVDASGNVYLSLGAKVVKVSAAGVRTVVAGTGTTGFSGDGGPAVQAQLGQPGALALDGAGDLYIADNAEWPGAARVRKVDRMGRISTVAGGGPAEPKHPYAGADLAREVHFGGILDLAVDARGSLVILEAQHSLGGSYVLRRLTCGIVGVLGTGLIGIHDRIAVDADGAIYITMRDASNAVVVKRILREDTVETVAGGGREIRFDGRPATAVAIRGSGALAIDSDGNLLVDMGDGIARVEKVAAPAAVPGIPCETVPDRGVWGWGWNVMSQLGDGSTRDSQGGAFEDPAITGATAVAGGTLHSLALKTDGTVWAWGWNDFGQLGDGTTLLRRRPVQVVGLTGVKAIAAGPYASMALKTDGTVWAWGWNGFGQLGDGTTTDRRAPVQVAGLRNVISISTHMVHSLAVTSDGTAWSWGWNGFGLHGNGTNWERHVPGPVLGLTGVTSVAAGYFHSLAVRADGTVWAWGWNAQGQLGDGSTTDRWLPTRVPGLTGATAVAAGYNHSVALVGGVAWSWGWNAFRQLGRNSPSFSATPLSISGPGVTAIAAGGYHTVAITPLYVATWGWDGNGQASGRNGLTEAVAIGAGGYHTLAVYRLTP